MPTDNRKLNVSDYDKYGEPAPSSVPDGDDVSGVYSLARQFAEEYNSSYSDALKGHAFMQKVAEGDSSPTMTGPEAQEGQQEHAKAQLESGQSAEQVVGGLRGLEEPLIDPVGAAAAAASGGTTFSLQRGLALLPSLKRGLAAGIVALPMDYVAGVTAEVLPIPESYKFPMTMAIGLLTGATVESKMEKALVKAMARRGTDISKAPAITKGLLDKTLNNIKAGDIGELEEEVATAAASLLQPSIRPAIKTPDGKIVVGKPGEIHAQIYERAGVDVYKDEQSGFVDEAGNFMSRTEAANKLAVPTPTPKPKAPKTDQVQTDLFKEQASALVAKKTGAKDPAGILAHYQDKYPELKKIRLVTMDRKGDEGFIKAMYDDQGNLDLSKSYVGVTKGATPITVRHEIEHLLDAIHGSLPGLQRQKFSRFQHDSFAAEYLAKKGPKAPKPTVNIPAPTGEGPISISEITPSTIGKAARFFSDEPPIPIPEGKAININYANLSTPDDVKNAIGKISTLFSDEINQARRGTIPDEQMIKLADELGVAPSQLLSRQPGSLFAPEQVLAARTLLVSSAENLVGLARAARGLEATPMDSFNFRRAFNAHYAIQAQVSGLAAEAGRALRVFGLPAGSGSLATKQIEELLSTLPGGSFEVKMGTTELMADAVITAAEKGPVALNAFARKAQKATTTDMLLEAWINAILSGPQTHAVNMISTALATFWQIPERFFAAGISKAMGDNAVDILEAKEMVYGLTEGFKDAISFLPALKAGDANKAGRFWRSLVTGEPEDPLTKLEIATHKAITKENFMQLPLVSKIASPQQLEEGGIAARAADILGTFVGYSGTVARTPGRLLIAEDDLYKGTAYRMELRALAMRSTQNLEPEARARRIQQIMLSPEEAAPDLHVDAVNFSRYATFTKRLGTVGESLQKVVASQPWLRLIAPFIRTPANIVKFFGERTPLAPFSVNVRAEISAGGARRSLALSKIALGSMVMGVTAKMAGEGHITGGGPVDPATERLLRDTGWQPYSVKIGDTYYSYSRVEPLGMLLGVAADFAEIAAQIGEQDSFQLASGIVMALGENLASKTWLSGVSEFIKAYDDPERYGSFYLRRLLGTVVPTGVAQLERTMDPGMSAVYSVMDTIKSRIPGWSKTLPPRRNVWGEPRVLQGGLGPDIASPFYISHLRPEGDSAASTEMLRLGMTVDLPERVQRLGPMSIPIPLGPNEYDRFMVLATTTPLDSTGEPLKMSVLEMIGSPDYKDLNDDYKKIMIQKKFIESRQLARQLLLDESPALQEIVDQLTKEEEEKQ